MPERSGRRREYFYHVDRFGRLFHDGTELRDVAFLDRFFARLQRDEHARHPDYPFLSPCAGELNFVAAELTPIVFRRLSPAGELVFAGASTLAFDPAELRTCDRGLLYHPAPGCGHGAFGPALVATFAEHIVEHGPGGHACRHGGVHYPIRPLPIR